MKKAWLLTFNAVTLLAWLLFLFTAAADGLNPSPEHLLLLAFAQGLAVFEVAHAALGIAGANWLLTLLQVSSRLLVAALLLLIPFGDIALPNGLSGYPVIAIAWSVTEVVRAAHYMGGLLGREIAIVTWLRYSLFIVLYPVGVTGEFLIMYAFADSYGIGLNAVTIGLAAITVSYAVFFPRLFGHMLRQRRKKLGSASGQ